MFDCLFLVNATAPCSWCSCYLHPARSTFSKPHIVQSSALLKCLVNINNEDIHALLRNYIRDREKMV